ncbi:MBOAT family O-acyltransferase, partial [Aliarcobacter butzleri]
IFGTNIPLPHIILPLGISFFTFTQIAFLVDAYKQEAKEYSLINYMLFVTYFPHLLAGPILHHKEMMPQFASKYNWVKNYRNIALGLFIFSIGLFKKVVIADTFAVWANAGFDTATTLNLIEAWATSLSYTFQLYFDFSGYTDMAIGISLMFNIKLPINFNSPYKALSIQDFWRRWHMTLSRFLRDYLYIPLGGNRKGNIR